MFNWFKNKAHPEYWIHYENLFKTGQITSIEATRFVVFDTETTGLNISKDKVLSIGAIAVRGNVIPISDHFECFIKQERFTSETVPIHGILKEGAYAKLEESEAIEKFITYIGNAVLVAHNASFDIAMINKVLQNRNLPKLKNKAIDTGFIYSRLRSSKNGPVTLDYLCKVFNISKYDRHTASGDAYITALIFLKTLSRLKQQENVLLSDLLIRRDPNSGLL